MRSPLPGSNKNDSPPARLGPSNGTADSKPLPHTQGTHAHTQDLALACVLADMSVWGGCLAVLHAPHCPDVSPMPAWHPHTHRRSRYLLKQDTQSVIRSTQTYLSPGLVKDAPSMPAITVRPFYRAEVLLWAPPCSHRARRPRDQGWYGLLRPGGVTPEQRGITDAGEAESSESRFLRFPLLILAHNSTAHLPTNRTPKNSSARVDIRLPGRRVCRPRNQGTKAKNPWLVLTVCFFNRQSYTLSGVDVRKELRLKVGP